MRTGQQEKLSVPIHSILLYFILLHYSVISYFFFLFSFLSPFIFCHYFLTLFAGFSSSFSSFLLLFPFIHRSGHLQFFLLSFLPFSYFLRFFAHVIGSLIFFLSSLSLFTYFHCYLVNSADFSSFIPSFLVLFHSILCSWHLQFFYLPFLPFSFNFFPFFALGIYSFFFLSPLFAQVVCSFSSSFPLFHNLFPSIIYSRRSSVFPLSLIPFSLTSFNSMFMSSAAFLSSFPSFQRLIQLFPHDHNKLFFSFISRFISFHSLLMSSPGFHLPFLLFSYYLSLYCRFSSS